MNKLQLLSLLFITINAFLSAYLLIIDEEYVVGSSNFNRRCKQSVIWMISGVLLIGCIQLLVILGVGWLVKKALIKANVYQKTVWMDIDQQKDMSSE